jgi:hypothetical protein
MLISQVQYPGVLSCLRATMVDGQGIMPGRATLTCSAKAVGTVAAVGDLTFSDGTNTVTWPGCRVANVRGSGGGGEGATLSILIEDARWQWSLSQISGRYNVPAEYFATVPLVPVPGIQQGNQNFVQVPIPPGEQPIRPETAKTAQELATLCLKAMKVANFNVSALDPKSYPSVEWDCEVPARALQALAERYGCRIVYRKDTNSVVLVKEGVGVPLPDGPQLYECPSLTPKPLPKRIVLRSAYIKYQMRFGLDAVGMEFDGSWRPLDQLSYRPPGGWTGSGPGSFAGLSYFYSHPNALPGTRTAQDAIALANAYVYRAYRVSSFRADGRGVLRIPQDGGTKDRVDYLKQVYLLPNKAQVTSDDLGRHSPAPAQVFGRHTPPMGNGLRNPALTYAQTNAGTEVVVPFSVDPEHALIIFAQPVFAFKEVPPGAVYEWHPAEIVLETACHMADKSDGDGPWQFRRREFGQTLAGGLSDLFQYVVKEELLATNVAAYGSGNTLIKTAYNDADLQGRANYYIAGEILKLTPDAADTRTYCGVVPAFPDGALQQVSTEFAAGDDTKPSTTISRNTEHDPVLPTYAGRRQREEADLSATGRAKERQSLLARIAKADGGGQVPG